MNQFVSGFLYTIIAYGTPLILCSLGGMMTGLTGRFNLGMEGMMLFSAFFSPSPAMRLYQDLPMATEVARSPMVTMPAPTRRLAMCSSNQK